MHSFLYHSIAISDDNGDGDLSVQLSYRIFSMIGLLSDSSDEST